MRSLDEKTYICETCHKQLSRNEMPCQAVFNKMKLDPIPDQLKDFKKFKITLIFKRIMFKKIAIFHRKGEFSKIKVSICNILIETVTLCGKCPNTELFLVRIFQCSD